MTRRRWMALLFALGSACFLVGPFPGYVQLVGDTADAVTFFVGSILFTAGGTLQSRLAWVERRSPGGSAAWWSAIVQSAGTLFFNVTTYQAMHVALTSSEYNRLVWRPDWRGSICFLVSGAIAYRASRRRAWHGLWPERGGEGWWQPGVNLLGCIFFGISAVAGYVVPSTGSMLDQAAANWNTSLGAACFLACALDTLRSGRASKMPLRREIRRLEHELEDDLQRREVGYSRRMNVFRRIGRAISRLSRSAAPVPSEGAMAAQVDLQQVEAVEQQEFAPEQEQDQASE